MSWSLQRDAGEEGQLQANNFINPCQFCVCYLPAAPPPSNPLPVRVYTPETEELGIPLCKEREILRVGVVGILKGRVIEEGRAVREDG